MSISSQSHGAGHAARHAESSAPARRRDDAESPHRAEPGRGVGSGGRHALVDALKQALGSLAPSAPPSPAADSDGTAPASPVATGSSPDERKDALHEFAHALFGALRPAGGDEGGSAGRGHGFAWGRTSPADLAQRLDAVIQRLQAGQVHAVPADSSAVEPVAVSPGDDTAVPPVDDAAVVPPTTPPVASRLTAAFERLSQVLAPTDTSSAGTLSSTDRLVEVLQRLASALRADSAGDLQPTGSLLDVTA